MRGTKQNVQRLSATLRLHCIGNIGVQQQGVKEAVRSQNNEATDGASLTASQTSTNSFLGISEVSTRVNRSCQINTNLFTSNTKLSVVVGRYSAVRGIDSTGSDELHTSGFKGQTMSFTQVKHLVSTDVSNAFQLGGFSHGVGRNNTVDVVRGDSVICREVRNLQQQRVALTTSDSLVTLIPVAVFQQSGATLGASDFNSLLTGEGRSEQTKSVGDTYSVRDLNQAVGTVNYLSAVIRVNYERHILTFLYLINNVAKYADYLVSRTTIPCFSSTSFREAN